MAKYFIILLLSLILTAGLAWADRDPIYIEAPGIVTEFDRNIFGLDMRIWFGIHGWEYYLSQTHLGYSLSRIKYMRKINGDIYLGIGVGQANYVQPTTSTPAIEPTEYVENPFYLSLGREILIASDLLVLNGELGYIVPLVKVFRGNQDNYPKNRLFLSAGIRYRFKI